MLILFEIILLTEGNRINFQNKIKGGNIPREYIPSVEKGFKMAMNNGVLAGYPIDNMKVSFMMVLSRMWIQMHYHLNLC